MSQPAFSFIVCIPGEAPVRHDLIKEDASLGRSPENDIQVLVAEVSVKHGRFTRVGGSFRFSDTGSTNGTTVNGAPVGAEGVELKPMDKVLLGTLVSAYFVPSAILDSTPVGELIASIEAAPKTAPPAAGPKTAPIAVAADVRTAGTLPGRTASGPSTVKLDQVRTPGAGGPPIRPAATPVPSRQPLPGGPPRPPGVPAGGPPRPPIPGQPAKIPTAQPSGGAGAPQTIPLKRVMPGAATIPLPKLPPKPGGQ